MLENECWWHNHHERVRLYRRCLPTFIYSIQRHRYRLSSFGRRVEHAGDLTIVGTDKPSVWSANQRVFDVLEVASAQGGGTFDELAGCNSVAFAGNVLGNGIWIIKFVPNFFAGSSCVNTDDKRGRINDRKFKCVDNNSDRPTLVDSKKANSKVVGHGWEHQHLSSCSIDQQLTRRFGYAEFENDRVKVGIQVIVQGVNKKIFVFKCWTWDRIRFVYKVSVFHFICNAVVFWIPRRRHTKLWYWLDFKLPPSKNHLIKFVRDVRLLVHFNPILINFVRNQPHCVSASAVWIVLHNPSVRIDRD